jgi:hypothetical protein
LSIKLGEKNKIRLVRLSAIKELMGNSHTVGKRGIKIPLLNLAAGDVERV